MAELWTIQNSWLIPVLPLIGAIVCALLGPIFLKGKSHWPVWIGMAGSAAISIWLLVQMLGMGWDMKVGGDAISSWTQKYPLAIGVTWFNWIEAAGFSASAGAWIDPLTVVMLCVVTGIGFLIAVFAAPYMHGERGYWRFFASIGVFIFAMTILVMADNFVLMYLGWEGVGLASYLLIGFYYNSPIARDAAKKAFIVNRIGDLGFAIGIFLIYLTYGTVSFFGTPADPGVLVQAAIGHNLGGHDYTAWIPWLLLLGAFGKSAQFPLFVWLPDAMAGPTPVSALIHAATMVTAGVYMLVRCAPMIYSNGDFLLVLGILACFTAVFAGSISLRQYDLKRDFAFSTCSQLGFMFVAVAALAPVAAIFHLVTHAFFKALLFLGSGVIMHATGGDLDMRHMSGFKKFLPATRWLMLLGCLALAGFPLLAGYFSKDEILAASFERSLLLGGMMLLSALMTAYYTFRLYYRVFEGELVLPANTGKHADHDAEDGDEHVHDLHAHHAGPVPVHGHHSRDQHGHAEPPKEPLLMLAVLAILAVGAIGAGFLNYPHREHSLGGFLGNSPSLHMGYSVAVRAFIAEDETVPEGKTNYLAASPFGQMQEQHDLEKGLTAEKRAAKHTAHTGLMIGSGLLAIVGILVARHYHYTHRQSMTGVDTRLSGIVRVLEARYWVDEIYAAVFVRPLKVLGQALDIIDRFLVDVVVLFVGLLPGLGGAVLRLTMQRGQVQGYATSMLLGITAVLIVVIVIVL
jgi:NADH-quinone oxidoreductase subunit L